MTHALALLGLLALAGCVAAPVTPKPVPTALDGYIATAPRAASVRAKASPTMAAQIGLADTDAYNDAVACQNAPRSLAALRGLTGQ